MARILNPTGWLVEQAAAGRNYEFPPFSIVEVWDEFHADHIAFRDGGKKRGLVTIEPNQAERDKFKENPVEFMRHQALKGLNEISKTLNDALINEKQAERDVKESKDGGEADRRIIDPKKFEAQLKKVEGWIEEVKSNKWSPEKYLKNQRRADDNEPWDYSGTRETKIGRVDGQVLVG